jgi:hypothetical protein
MTKPASEKPVHRKAAFAPYAVVWSMLGALGLGYLGVAIFMPSWLGDLKPAAGRADSQHADTEVAMTNLSVDVAGLHSSIAKLQLDVAAVKSDVQSQAGQTQLLGTQLSALEDKIRLGQTPVASAETTTAPAAESPPQDLDMAPASADAPAKTAAQPTKVINKAPAQGAPIVTGSVNSGTGGSQANKANGDVISFGAAIVKPAGKPIGVQIGSGPSVDGLRSSWNQLSDRSDKLKKLKARYTDSGDAVNPNFNLIAGPLKSKAEAARICKELAVQQVSCKVGEFKGEEL